LATQAFTTERFVGEWRRVRETLDPSIEFALPLRRRKHRRARFVRARLQALADGVDAHIDDVVRIGDQTCLDRLPDDLLLLRL
jgi:hypothetical protein